MKAVLKVESVLDTSRVFKILMANNITVLKTREMFLDIGLIVTIEVADQNELNHLVLELNRVAYFGVRPIKTYSGSWIDRLFKRGKRNEGTY